MDTSKVVNYKVILSRKYNTISAANRFVKQYEAKNGEQRKVRKQFLVEKLGYMDYSVTLNDLRRKLTN